MSFYRYAIAVGSNRRHGRHGGPGGVVRAGIEALREAGLVVTAVSPVLPTPALGPSGRSFANAALLVETPLDPPELLSLLKMTERAFGRRRGRRWGPRVLDLDIILWSGGRWPRHGGHWLVVPHRSMTQRDFVLEPLVRIAPDWRIPRTALAVRHAYARLRRRAG